MKKKSVQMLLGAILFTVFTLSIIGIFTHRILVHEHIMAKLLWVTMAYSIAILLLNFVYGVWQDTEFKRRLIAGGKKPWEMFLVMLLVIPIMSYFAFNKGLPACVHALTSKPSNMVVTVKDMLRSGRFCSDAVFLEEYSYFMNSRICGVSKAVWRELKPGDRIRLTGEVSFVGFTFLNDKEVLIVK